MDIFCAEIGTRLEEDGCATGPNRPKTVNVHWYRRGIGSKSRQAPITTGASLDRDVLFKMAKAILKQLEQEKQLFPCSGCSLSVTGFTGGGQQKGGGERAIDSFFTKRKAEPEVEKEGVVEDGLEEEVEEQLEFEVEGEVEGEEEGDDRDGRSPSPRKRLKMETPAPPVEPPKPKYPPGSIQARMEEARKRFFSRPSSTPTITPSVPPAPLAPGQSPERT